MKIRAKICLLKSIVLFTRLWSACNANGKFNPYIFESIKYMLDYAKIQPIYLNIFSAFLLNIEMNANITTKTGFFLLSLLFGLSFPPSCDSFNQKLQLALLNTNESETRSRAECEKTARHYTNSLRIQNKSEMNWAQSSGLDWKIVNLKPETNVNCLLQGTLCVYVLDV